MEDKRLDEIMERFLSAKKEMAKLWTDISAPSVSVAIYSDISDKTFVGLRKLLSLANQDIPYLLDEIARLTAENEALKAELNGNCWACAKAKPYPKSVTGTMMTCEHLSARNILAANASRNCPHWQWRGETNANATD